jgi:hypothetical protein
MFNTGRNCAIVALIGVILDIQLELKCFEASKDQFLRGKQLSYVWFLW